MEMLIALAVFSIASLAVFQLLIYGIRTFRQSDQRGDTQRQLLKASQHLVRQGLTGSVASLTLVYPSGQPTQGDLCLSFCSLTKEDNRVDLDPYSHLPLYQAQLLYYRNPTTNEFYFSRKKLTAPTSAPEPLSVSDLQAKIALADGEKLMSNCTEFQILNGFDGPATDSPGYPWYFHLQGRSKEGQYLDVRFLVHAQ